MIALVAADSDVVADSVADAEVHQRRQACPEKQSAGDCDLPAL